MEESWKPVVGFEGLYEVSNLGEIRSLARPGAWSTRILKQKTTQKGYREVKLFKGGKRHYFRVHRIVAEAFVPNPKKLEFINHKDERKSNNEASNLEWCSTEYNNRYGTRISRAAASRSRAVVGMKRGEIVYEFASVNSAAEAGFSPSCVSRCCNGLAKSHLGIEWRFKTPEN